MIELKQFAVYVIGRDLPIVVQAEDYALNHDGYGFGYFCFTVDDLEIATFCVKDVAGVRQVNDGE